MNNTQIKLITYNIDGLPETLDLRDLPWFLKPVAWFYRLFKGTTKVTLNDNHNKDKMTLAISKYLAASDADVIAVQEDFNYHRELAMHLLMKGYELGTHTGGFYLKNLFSRVEFWSHFPLPRFKADGLNIITKKSRVNIIKETIVRWKKGNGYISHANDLLTHKGFRLYSLVIEGAIIDVYIVHMDADFYDKDVCPDVEADIKARRCQLQQLTNFIIKRYNEGIHRPIIIMGDTNSSPEYQWDVDNINDYLYRPFNGLPSVAIHEAQPSNRKDVDRLFYINDQYTSATVRCVSCRYNESMSGYSDHLPLEVIVNVYTK